jgi:ketosteroid isomerase-like protein
MLTFLLAAATVWTPTRADIDAITKAKLTDWPAYYKANDADGLANFLADGFVALSDDGSSETKEQVVAWVRANKWAGGDNGFSYKISDIAFYGPDVANVYGVGSYNAKDCRMRYTSANIFVRDGGRWKPKFSHTSAAACEKDKD